MRYNFTSQAVVSKRRTYTGNKTTYIDVATPVYGFFGPTSTTHIVDTAQFIDQQYQFVCDGSTNIESGDRLLIETVSYSVKGVVRHRQLSQDILICTIFQPIKK